jgi:hypothetical protein
MAIPFCNFFFWETFRKGFFLRGTASIVVFYLLFDRAVISYRLVLFEIFLTGDIRFFNGAILAPYLFVLEADVDKFESFFCVEKVLHLLKLFECL